MRRVSAVILGMLLNLPATAGDVTSFSAAQLTWIEGHWGGTTNGIAMEEHWTSPAGGELVGMHKDVKGDQVISFEFFRIASDSAGRLCYFASPNGVQPTAFCAVEMADNRVVFENGAHDFPQRILYWLDAEHRLHARIEGNMDGKSRSKEWVWTRIRED